MSVIHYQKKEDMKFETAGDGILRAEMLPGMVDGVHTYKCKVAAGTVVTLETFGDQTQIYYFTRGEGYVATPKKAFNIEEPSLFIPNMDKEANILHAATDMEFLQLTSVMLPEDYEQFDHWHIALPRFCPLSGCIEYIEGFRPEGIKALSILDTHFLTRMTMGAIIGKGPNKAAPHSHDNLYQWYYGMPGTKFIYRAADEEIELHEGDWAFIPTDIEHAIEIEEDESRAGSKKSAVTDKRRGNDHDEKNDSCGFSRSNGSITYGMRGQCRERDDTDYGTDVAGGGHRCGRRIHDGRKRTCYPAFFLVGRGDET